LYDTGIIGGKGIQIKPIFDGSPTAQSGDTLTTSTRPGLTDLVQQKLTPLQQKIEGAFTHADTLLMNVNEVLDDKTKKDLRESIAGLNKLMKSLESSAEVLNKLLKNNQGKLDSSLTNFNELSSNFAKLSDSLNNAGLGRTLTSLESTVSNLDKILSQIEQGDGTMGKLLKDEELYDNLSSTTRELNLLLKDFRLNPKRYVNVSVFGKKQKEYALPENDPAEQIEQP
jgi:phospholipid/cholesterol/gamma-HCH transport system substrate-binding protein